MCLLRVDAKNKKARLEPYVQQGMNHECRCESKSKFLMARKNKFSVSGCLLKAHPTVFAVGSFQDSGRNAFRKERRI